MSDIMIVGSAGFIGSNLCNYLVQHTKYNISSIDDLSIVSDLKNLQPSINSKYRHTFFLAEAESAKIIGKIFELEKPRTIVYNLASTHLEQIGRWKIPHEDAIKTLQLWLDLSYLNGVKKFIVISSPKSLYQKLSSQEMAYINACEMATERYKDKFTVQVLKPCNVFGPRQSLRAPVPRILTSVLEDVDVGTLEGEPQDWMYVKDFFFTFLDFLDKDQSGVFYIRNTEWMSKRKILELAQGIVSGETQKWWSHKGSSYKTLNEETVEHSFVEWIPQYKVPSALEHTFCWFDANRWAWR